MHQAEYAHLLDCMVHRLMNGVHPAFTIQIDSLPRPSASAAAWENLECEHSSCQVSCRDSQNEPDLGQK